MVIVLPLASFAFAEMVRFSFPLQSQRWSLCCPLIPLLWQRWPPARSARFLQSSPPATENLIKEPRRTSSINVLGGPLDTPPALLILVCVGSFFNFCRRFHFSSENLIFCQLCKIVKSLVVGMGGGPWEPEESKII